MRRTSNALTFSAITALTVLALTGCNDGRGSTNPPSQSPAGTVASIPAKPAPSTSPTQATPDVTSGPVSARNWSAPGSAAINPLLAADIVIAADDTHGTSTLRALDAATGKNLWSARLDRPVAPAGEGEAHETLKVIAHDGSGIVYAAWPTASADALDGRWTVHAFALPTGKAIWTTTTAPGAPLYATSAGVAVGTGFASSDAEVAEPTGTVMLAKGTGKSLWATDGTAPLGATADTVLVASGTTPAGLAGLDPATGKTRWTHTEPGRSVTAEAAADHRVLVTLRDQNGSPVTAAVLDAATGTQVGPGLALPANADFTAHIDTDAQVALVGTGDTVRGIDLTTGKALWSQPSGPDPVSVAGSGLAWISATGAVVDSRTGARVSGVNAEGVVLAGAGIALTLDGSTLTATALPPSTH